ncbi:MAG TPA: DEAD/DEAH box helicase, partial [Lacipirellulaceae bacterium]|nr:DEAD/DEAH box helicase [Lacipirellulaceae bacterium]
MPLEVFHPFIRNWFAGRFSAPSDAQAQSWPAIIGGEHTLLAAPTGSGKTLAAFLASIDQLLKQAIDHTLPDETQVVYVSPLKALSNDIHRNLQEPLAEIHHIALAAGADPRAIRIAVRTGDTPTKERQAMLRKAPHILVTTPESLYLLLTSAKSREILRKVRTVIVDEIHSLARDKRGSHLALSLARLDHLCDTRPTRIGLSATQRPIGDIARFLVGASNLDPAGIPQCRIIDTGHIRELDLAIEVPSSELSAVCPVETWQEIYARLCELINGHRSTLVFVNTRRLAERVTHYLEEKLGKGSVASHHGSLSRETRLKAEEQLKAGQLKAIVATASLELGIDIGYIDLVCQIGSPRSIATFLQRVGRAGHALGRVPKGRLFALTRDELIEALALVRAVKRGRLDQVDIPTAPLDILAQQIVASVACDEWQEDELYAMCREASPYRDLERREFDEVVGMLSEGIAPGNRSAAYLHRDQINHRLRGRRNARISALTSGGAIPEMADYRVVTEGDRTFVGTLNEDFAMESQTGNVFQLGNMSWRILYVRGGEVTVRDAHGAPATVPFWLGEAPGRTPELSREFSELREEIWERAENSDVGGGAWLQKECGADDWAAQQAIAYVSAQAAAMGVIPSQRRVVFERFFDESGGMQLVIHAPFGARINRAWGLALRKCFCRNFDFELQAIADDNGIVLAMGPQQSFPLEQMFALLDPSFAESVLLQALMAVPMFGIRWRWNVTRALAVLRLRGGKKVPPHLQRFRAEDLLTAVFPMQTACFEHRTGDLEPPDHPLIRQTVHDCLHEVMDFDRWMSVLSDIQAGRIELIGKDTREPSPFSHQLVNSNVYAFLDDAPLEDRRARAVAVRRSFRADDVRDLGRLDPEVIAQVKADAWPTVRDADELHDALLSTGAMPERECAEWRAYFDELEAQDRVVRRESVAGRAFWIAVERWPVVSAALSLFPDQPPRSLPESLRSAVSKNEACQFLVRGRLEIVGPTIVAQVATDLAIPIDDVQVAIEQLELSGVVLRGQFTAQTGELEWCDRRLLARIHRQTLDGLRRQIAPVDIAAFM